MLAALYFDRADSRKHAVRRSVPAVYGGNADSFPKWGDDCNIGKRGGYHTGYTGIPKAESAFFCYGRCYHAPASNPGWVYGLADRSLADQSGFTGASETECGLEEEQDLLAQEIRVQSDEASIQARNGIYDSLSSEVAGQLTLLTKLLSKESLSSDDWNHICLIGTYIKRFCNLQLTYQETQTIPMGDLALSLQDMAKCMKNIGIRTSLDFCPISNLEPELILLIMKTLEEILEEADFRLTSVAIQISDTVCFEITGTDHEFIPRFLEGGYRLQAEKVPAGYRLLLLKEGEVVQS